MSRPVIRRARPWRRLIWLALVGALASSPALAQPSATPPTPGDAAPVASQAAPGATTPAVDDAPAPPVPAADSASGLAEPAPAGERELGARLGVAMGRRFTPGGVRVAGVMLYRLSQSDWFDGSMAFTFGRSRSTCFTDRDGAFACDYGVIDGTAIDLVAGIRRFLPGPERFAPYVRAGVGVRVISFGGDDVRGLAIPVSAGVGVRARVNELVAVGADAGAEAGIAWLDHGLGSESQLGIVLQATVELWLE
jgi:hypothetical protein